jgi:integrase
MPRQPKKQRGIFERVKKSGVWWIRYADQFGKMHIEKCGLFATAENLYHQRKTEMLQGKFDPGLLRRRQIGFDELIKDRAEVAKVELRSLANEQYRLEYWRARFTNKAALVITEKDIQAAKNELAKDMAPASVNRFLATIKTVFTLALRNEKIDKSPATHIKLFRLNNKRVRHLSEEEEGRLFAVLPEQHKPLVIIAMHTGLRKGEQLALLWSDVDFKLGQVRVRESKSDKPRVIPMNAVVMEVLRRIPRRIDNPYVFPGRKAGKPLTTLPREWDESLEKAKINDFRWHDLRHTFASRLVMAGADLYAVSKLLGHADLKMTTRSAHLAPNYLKNTVDLLSKGVVSTTQTATGG